MTKDIKLHKVVMFFLLGLFLFSCAKRKETKGTIIGMEYNPIIGYSWDSKVWYEYRVGERTYFDTLFFYEDDVILMTGDEVELLYDIDNPENSRIIN